MLSTRGLAIITVCMLAVAMPRVSYSQADGKAIESETPTLIEDVFDSPDHPTRKLLRGNWTVQNGTAHVTQDDELYRKNKDHGPMLSYSVQYSSASAVAEFRPQGCQSVVFTMDADDGGHAFRIVLRPEPTHDAVGNKSASPSGVILAFGEKPKEGNAKSVVLQRGLPSLKDDQWHRIECRVEGETALVNIDGEEFKVQHPKLKCSKAVVKLGFAFGSLSVRKFELVAI
jgi:hypothetical protein